MNNLIYSALVIVLVLLVLYYIGRSKQLFGKIFMIVSVFILTLYILWRIFYSLPLQQGLGNIFPILLLIAEIIGYLQFMVFVFLNHNVKNFKNKDITPYNGKPSIDILIARYNEDIDLVLKTALAALKVKAPGILNVYICDDMNTKELKDKASQYGINYITRDNNEHAKAGNYNNALQQVNGEFVIFLDADMILKPDFINKTLGYFNDEEVALVQTPQAFYNADPYQYEIGKDIFNEQDFFMRQVEVARDNYNALVHVGTNAIFRKSSLEAIGYIPTKSITEDMATGMLLQAHGYKTHYHNEVLALGLNPLSFDAILKQRIRWARGSIQVFKSYPPLKEKGLKAIQKLIYIDGLIYWYTAIQKMIFTLSPIIFALFGILFIKLDNAQIILLVYAPVILIYYLTYQLIGNKYRSFFNSHRYEYTTAPYLARAILLETIGLKEHKFIVTAKTNQGRSNKYNIYLSLPHLILSILNIISIIILTRIIYNTKDFNISVAYLVVIGWIIYNLLGSIFALQLIKEKPRYRAFERIIIKDDTFKVIYNNKAYHINDFSSEGLSFSKPDLNLSKDQVIELTLDNHIIKGIVRRVDQKYIGVQFTNLNQESIIFINEKFVEQLHAYYGVE